MKPSQRFVRVVSAIAIVAFLLLPAAARAQDTTSSTERQMLDELRSIRQLLERILSLAPTAGDGARSDRAVTVPLTSLGPSLGRVGANTVIVEFTDLQCPYCRQFSQSTFPRLQKEYIETGKARFFTVDFPIASLHPMAIKAAHVSRCAGEQNRLWDMRQLLLANDQPLNDFAFIEMANLLSLKREPFAQCVSDKSRYESQIGRDIALGERLGINGTPSFVIGQIQGGNVEGKLLIGARAFDDFDEMLKAILKSPSSP